MMKVLGRTNSSNVAKVLWALGETGTAYERKDFGGEFGGLDSTEYLALNPHGRIPTLLDGDVAIWESNAIVRYIGAKYGNDTFYPADPGRRAEADRWMDWASCTLAPAIGLVRKPIDPIDQAALVKARRTTDTLFDRLDAWLVGRDFLSGPNLTIADIAVGAHVHRYLSKASNSKHEALADYYERLKARLPYVNAIVEQL